MAEAGIYVAWTGRPRYVDQITNNVNSFMVKPVRAGGHLLIPGSCFTLPYPPPLRSRRAIKRDAIPA